jgi:hypothetical protein
MESGLLELMIKRRQLELWRAIVKNYEVEPSLNAQVQQWIRKGEIQERAYDAARRQGVRLRRSP